MPLRRLRRTAARTSTLPDAGADHHSRAAATPSRTSRAPVRRSARPGARSLRDAGRFRQRLDRARHPFEHYPRGASLRREDRRVLLRALPSARVVSRMDAAEIRLRRATMADLPALGPLIAASARELSRDDYAPEQVEGALRGAFGTDTQFIRDGSYFVIEAGGRLAGCGGWSRRRTLFGSDARSDRDSTELDPAVDAAKIRAFFIHPEFRAPRPRHHCCSIAANRMRWRMASGGSSSWRRCPAFACMPRAATRRVLASSGPWARARHSIRAHVARRPHRRAFASNGRHLMMRQRSSSCRSSPINPRRVCTMTGRCRRSPRRWKSCAKNSPLR